MLNLQNYDSLKKNKIMNISELHTNSKPVSTSVIFKEEKGGMVISMQILKNEILKEHVTQIPACLFCISGKVIFENENGIKQTLASGDYIQIEALVKHWVNGIEDSQLLLCK